MGSCKTCASFAPQGHLACFPLSHHIWSSPRVVEQREEIDPNLVAFCAFVAGPIASVSRRKKGHLEFLKKEVAGDLPPHTEWKKGINKALKFMANRTQCPSRHPMILDLQARQQRRGA